MLGVRAAVVPCETISQALSKATPLSGDEELCRANKHDCAALPTSSLREINARYRYTCGFMTENAVELFMLGSYLGAWYGRQARKLCSALGTSRF